MKPLNLLPEPERELARLRFVGGVLRFWSFWFVCLVLVGVLIMVAVGIIVRFQENTIAQQVEALFSQELVREIAGRETVINNANDRLLKARSIVEGRVLVHPLFVDLIAVLPDRVILRILNYNRSDGVVSLGGFAPFREDVLGIEESLLENEFVKSVESPVSNILEPVNVEFTFTITLQ